MGQGVVEGVVDWIEDAGENIFQSSAEEVAKSMRLHLLSFLNDCFVIDVHILHDVRRV
jgi:hypothetical protein